MSKYIRTKNGKIYKVVADGKEWVTVESKLGELSCKTLVRKTSIAEQADDITELYDEIVLIENGNEHNIVYLQEAYDRIDEYREQGNYEPRLIGRIKVGLDKKAVAEWKENEQGLYDWVLL